MMPPNKVLISFSFSSMLILSLTLCLNWVVYCWWVLGGADGVCLYLLIWDDLREGKGVGILGPPSIEMKVDKFVCNNQFLSSRNVCIYTHG